MEIIPEIASDMMDGETVFTVTGERIGLHRVRRVWFAAGSGNFIADVGARFMWSDGPRGPWKAVPNTAPCERGIHQQNVGTEK